MTTVGVVIPCRNEARWLHEVLQGLESQTRPANDVVVVDDGSTDETSLLLEEHLRVGGLPLRIVAGPTRGVAAAVNAGIAALATDLVVRLDGHCRPSPDYIARAVALIETPDVGVVGGVWVIKPGAETLEAGAIAIAAAHRIGSGGAMYRSGGQSCPRDVDTVPFGCFRRTLWHSLAGLDERLLANEDYEFNHRVRSRGLRVVLDPAMKCTYFARPTVAAVARQYRWYCWWKARMLLRYPGSVRLRQLIPAMLIPVLIALLITAPLAGGGWWWLLPAAYPATMLAGAAHGAASRGRWQTTGWLAATFMTMHLMWSAGFWASLGAAVASRREAVV